MKIVNEERLEKLVDDFIYANAGEEFTEKNLMSAVNQLVADERLSLEEAIFVYNELFSFAMKEHRVAKFEKVSNFPVDVSLPQRATTGSAGYDFFAPEDIDLMPGEETIVQTGIRCAILDRWVLKIYPRSGLGFKYRAGIANTVGIIDSDYYHSDNEGHIMVKLVNNGSKEIHIAKGEGFCQGIFSEYGLAIDDCVANKRNGGFGSTTK